MPPADESWNSQASAQQNTGETVFMWTDLLVLFGIVAVGILLLATAIQFSREVSRRTQCGHRLRSWTEGMIAHEAARGAFPIASLHVARERQSPDSLDNSVYAIPDIGPAGNRQSWPPRLWEFVDERRLGERFPPYIPFHKPPNTIPETYDGLCAQPIDLYYCPSDRGIAFMTSDRYWRVRGNYVVNWGPIPYQILPGSSMPPARAPFGFRDYYSRDKPFVARFRDLTDGASKTLIMSETIMHPHDESADQRGDIMNEDGGAGLFMTIQGPNGRSDAVKRHRNCDAVPRLPCSVAMNDLVHDRYAIVLAARSNHSGGVNASTCDGGVRFVADHIDLDVWQALSTINGNESDLE